MQEWNADLFDKLEDQILNSDFVFTNLNYTHYFFNEPDNYMGSIIFTSIRVYQNNGVWTKRVVTHYNDTNLVEREISYERDLEKDIVNKIEKNTNLRNLANNYANDKLLENGERFELIYNSVYKIIGTLDKHIKDIDYIKTMLLVDDILEDEKKKVSDLL